MHVVDFHTHAFPDGLADRAVSALAAKGHTEACLDGRVGSLLASMDAAGIARSVVLSIATKPEQFDAILRWSRGVASERLVPFASVHPEDPDPAGRVEAVRQAGLKGIKLHPYYQDFVLDEERLWPLYARVEQTGLILVCHTGFDIAFERVRRCDPARIVRVLDRFPRLKFVATHLGGWADWDEVRRVLVGRPIHIEISYAFDFLPPADARELLVRHPAEHLLFGTDSPWAAQQATLDALRSFHLDPDREAQLLGRDAEALLASV